MQLADYLQQHFVDAATLGTLAGITPERLGQLLALGAVPAASYVCDGRAIVSAVFGRIEIDEAIVGEFYRAEHTRWVRIAHAAAPGRERLAVEAVLVDELRAALQQQDVLALDAAAIEARIQDYLPSFFDGTFGLCVADPSSGRGIVSKEVLQERLSAIHAAAGTLPVGVSKALLLQWIDAFAVAAMPFSPAERARSSRKRLVEDFRPVVAAMQESA